MKKEWVDITEKMKEEKPEIFKLLEKEMNRKHKSFGDAKGYYSMMTFRGGVFYWLSSNGYNQPLTVQMGI